VVGTVAIWPAGNLSSFFPSGGEDSIEYRPPLDTSAALIFLTVHKHFLDIKATLAWHVALGVHAIQASKILHHAHALVFHAYLIENRSRQAP
jgi:hypothetical protein